MPKTRLEVAREVYEAFCQAETAAEHSAATIARCAATLIEARGKAHLPPAVGSEIFALMARSSNSAFNARHAIVAAHPLLDELARNLGIVGFGPDKEKVPNSPFVGTRSPMRLYPKPPDANSADTQLGPRFDVDVLPPLLVVSRNRVVRMLPLGR